MKKRTIAKLSTSIFVVFMALVLLFSPTANTVAGILGPEYLNAQYIKELNSVDTQYENFLDSNVMYRLPSTVDEDEVISVIVTLDTPSLLDSYDKSSDMSFRDYANSGAASAVQGVIAEEKAKLCSKLNAMGIAYSTGKEYDTVMSGFELLIEAKHFDSLRSSLSDGADLMVSEVYNVAETQLVENKVNVYDTGIFNSKDFGFDGEGMVVAVLDTGLDYTHSAFAATPPYFTSKVENLGLTKGEVSSVLANTNAADVIPGLLADDVYISNKVPFAFDYADNDPDVYSIHNNHGTHVSGVIVGHDDEITGVAPNAQLVSMKIFSDTYDSARASWIIAALEDCVELGVDVINMSLGTACGFSRQIDEEKMSDVYDKIRDRGISLVVAASNSYSSAHGSEKNGNLGLSSNPDTGTVGSPSTFDGAISIASIEGTKTPYILYNGTIVYFTEASDSANEEKNFFDEILGDEESAEIEYVVIPGAGRPADYTGIEIKDKIALVRRGSTTFEEKANAAQKAGAKGIIVYNNTSGDIKMNAGITSIPICSISQDDGELIAEAGSGTIKISKSQSSGPFMSDFSSWGPTPDLNIKPEITAHGGNIYSAVTGGEYDRLSGTSMACPNMAGVIILLRQYVLENHPASDYTLPGGEIDYVKVNAIVNRLLMSTADVIYNKNGLPYAVRKQGAGLANLADASNTSAYILTYDREDGSVMDKSKIELGDDPAKTGVYNLKFSIFNFGTKTLSYDISTLVMTEGISDTLTYAGETVVTAEGYLLEGSKITVSCSGGEIADGTRVTVGSGKTADVAVTIELSEENKKYLDESFANGMYVEGFVTLKSVDSADEDLCVPFLAFYGDWTKAPLFDLEYFETNADELDDSIELLDKNLPDAYASRPIGGVELDYISYLGSYYFQQNPKDRIISANKDYIALSNTTGTIHSLRFLWMGMLRNAEKIEVTITDDATGEVIFEITDYEIRKSYSDGGSYIYPANVEIEFDAYEHNLKNNSTYTVKVQGYLNYGNGGLETNESNTFEFPFTTDFQAPALTGVEYYTTYDKSEKKNRLFAKMAIYDNHYAMAMQVGYVYDNPDYDPNDAESYETILNSFSHYLTPIYSQKDSVTYVEYELTDYIFDIKNNANQKNTFVASIYDYAMNYAIYEIPLPDDFVDFYFAENEISLSTNEVYTLTPLLYPDTEWPELLTYSVKGENDDVIRIVNNKVVAVADASDFPENSDDDPGNDITEVSAAILVTDPNDKSKQIEINVKVKLKGAENFKNVSKPVADDFDFIDFETLKVYYQLSNEDRDLGEKAGDITALTESFAGLTFYPSESIKLNGRIYAYFPDDVEIVFESGNEAIAKVEKDSVKYDPATGKFSGIITGVSEGFTSIYVRVKMDGANTNLSKSFSVTVKDPFVRTGPSLDHYYGLGGKVEIPADMLFTQIGDYAFANFWYVEKGPDDEISEDSPDATKQTYIGDDTITEVIIPEGVEKIGAYAFANLTKLTTVKLPSTLKYIEYGAFYGCKSLTKVTGLEHVVTINKYAFEGCNLNGKISLNSAHAIADYAFAYNAELKEVVISKTLRSIGAYAFAGNTKLSKVTIDAEKIKLGDYAFAGCSELKTININTSVIPAGAFRSCSKLESVKIGKDVNVISPYAFTGANISKFEIDSANTGFKLAPDGSYILTKDGTTLVAVAPALEGKLEIKDTKITTVGQGAFSGNRNLTSVTIPSVTVIEDYAFADCTKLASVSLGKLTRIGNYAFFATALKELPNISGIKVLGDYAFAATRLTSVVIPDGMTVGEGAFTECDRLASVAIGNNVTLELGAFMYTVKLRPVPEKDYFVYTFEAPLTQLTIGDNVVIGESAFYGAASLEKVTLGKGAKIMKQAFYNTPALYDIDLSGVTEIGELAFSGDTYYKYMDNTMSYPLVENNSYVFKVYASAIKKADLSSLEQLGRQAFLYCEHLEGVTLGDKITEIPYYAFANCSSLSKINLNKVKVIGEAAFSMTGLSEVDISSATDVDNYAFVQCEALTSVKFGDNIENVGEGAFSYCFKLAKTEKLNKIRNIGEFAFAFSALTELDLTGAESIGEHAFSKEFILDKESNSLVERETPASIKSLKLGNKLRYLGDNPFVMCSFEKHPFSSIKSTSFNGNKYTEVIYTYDVSDTVKVIDGSLYLCVPYGLELITYVGLNDDTVVLPDDTVKISARAFLGCDVKTVITPKELNSVGHKAFYKCDGLYAVVFNSYEAPNLEEEYDQDYFYDYNNIPGSGEYPDVDTVYVGLGIVPFTMMSVNNSNVYYGANFTSYIGKLDDKMIIVRPSNGQYYDTFIYGQYFGTYVGGALAPTDDTVAAIEAIDRLPEPVQLEHEALVIAAREAYDKISSIEQQALVTNYAKLQTAEQRIAALKAPAEDVQPPEDNTPEVEEPGADGNLILIIVIIAEAAIIFGLIAFFTVKSIMKNAKKKENEDSDSDYEEEATESNLNEDAEDELPYEAENSQPFDTNVEANDESVESQGSDVSDRNED